MTAWGRGAAHAVATDRFISEQILPAKGTADAASMAKGEPGLPASFTWRGREYIVAKTLRKWKESGPCHHGSGELYLRKHWFEVVMASGERMMIYFERQGRRGSSSKARWWLYTVGEAG